MWATAHVGDAVRGHCRAVAELAKEMAERLRASGLLIDVAAVEAAALLHDIAKSQPHHAGAGAAMIRAFGFPEVADIVARHSDLADWNGEIDESAVVFLVDKLVCGDRRVTLAERFAPAFARFRDDPAACAETRRRLDRAEDVLRAVQARTAIAPVGAVTRF